MKRYRYIILFLLLGFIAQLNSYAQYVSTDSLGKRKVVAQFDTIPFQLVVGEMISKTLIVVNNDQTPLSFSVNVSIPENWRSLTDRTEKYVVEAGDSIFVPVRIVPIGKIRGNTKYLINAYILKDDSLPVTAAYFYVLRDQVRDWVIGIGPSDKIYYLNNSNVTNFSVSIINSGNEEQDLVMEFENLRNEIIITDTLDNIIKKNVTEISLKPNQDTTFKYKTKFAFGLRNYKIVDTETHRPFNNSETRKYSMFVRTAEPQVKPGFGSQKIRKVDFIKLGNTYKANPYSSKALPLVMDANVYNILGGQPMLNLTFRGNTLLDNNAQLNYFSQLFFSNFYYTNQYLLSSFNYISYIDKKYTIQLGDIGGLGGGTVAASGKGASFVYRFMPKHSAGVFYTQFQRVLQPPRRQSYGFLYTFQPTKARVSVGYTSITDRILKLTSNYASVNASINVIPRQSFSISGAFANHNSTLATNKFNTNGFQFGLGYTGSFLQDNKLRTSFSGMYISPNFQTYNLGRTVFMFHSTTYNLSKWSLNLMNNYNRQEFITSVPVKSSYKSSNLDNTFIASRKLSDYYIGTGAFYSILTQDTLRFHTRGIIANSGKYDYKTNTLSSFSIQTGYNRALFESPKRNYFFFNFFSLVRYRTLSLNFRYNYGSPTALDYLYNKSKAYPQSINLGLNHQFQFKNTHFILQTYGSYSYFNRFKRHSFNYGPDLYYYTNNGWRFRLWVNYTYIRSNANEERSLIQQSNVNINDAEATKTHSINVSLGVRKEFGIPIPKSKIKYYNVNFVAFIDLNGNDTLDNNEITLENVIIRLNEDEVLTNEKGLAYIQNVKAGNYKISATSLVELEGYFPDLNDQVNISRDYSEEKKIMYIPFTKGVKLFGKVVLDRDKSVMHTSAPIDLGGIKITAVDGRIIHTLTGTDGTFDFYVPLGKYVIHMDEGILDERFTLLQNDIELNLDRTTDKLFITFYIVEKRRKINKKRFGANGELLSSESIAGADSLRRSGVDLVSIANNEAAKVNPRPTYDVARDAFLKGKEDATKTTGLIYTIQVGAFRKPLNPNYFNGLTNLMYERLDAEFVRISVGKLANEAEAMAEKDNLIRVGFPDAYVTVYYNGKKITLEEARQIAKSNAK